MNLHNALTSEALSKNVLSTRAAAFMFGKCCLIVAVWLAYETGNNLRLASLRKLPGVDQNWNEDIQPGKVTATLGDYSSIISRNLLASQTSDDGKKDQKEVITPLKLRLVGTNLGSASNSVAIIEDSAKNQQEVFEINEMVFDQAKLIEIQKDSVKLERNGKHEILAMQEDATGSGDSSDTSTESSDENKTEFTVPEEELNNELANLPRLLSQARAVPYFRNGQSIGMRLFAIRSGSLYEKLGLKNGDIVKSVNNTSLSDPAQALKLFEQLRSEKSISVKTERNGQDVDLRYSIQ